MSDGEAEDAGGDLVVRALDTTLPLRLADPADPLRAALRPRWARCLDPTIPTHVTAEPITLGAGPDPDAQLSEITQQITRALIEAQIGRLIMLHAVGMARPDDGRSLVCVAPGGTGKTTLAQQLGRRFGYLSDETIGIAPDGSIHPYPKPLSRRTPHGTPRKEETSPDDLGLLPAPAAPRLGRLVLLRRDPGVHRPEVTELPLLDGLHALIPESSSLAALPRALHVLRDLVEATGPVLRWTYAESTGLDELADAALERP